MSLAHPVIVIAIAISVWWLSTGLVLLAVRRSEVSGREGSFVMPWMTFVGLGGLAMLFWARDVVTPIGSYVGFLGALLVWAWHEAAFLTGMLTGPAKGDCPKGLNGIERFRAAWLAVRDHELAILATAAVLWIGLAGGDNLFGLATFGILWAMRISAKLVIFFGAPNAVSDLMPQRISHLKTYFRTDGITRLFPVVLAGAGSLFAVLAYGASEAVSEHAIIGHLLLASFVALAIVEHLILVLPISDTALWRWAMPPRKPASEA